MTSVNDKIYRVNTATLEFMDSVETRIDPSTIYLAPNGTDLLVVDHNNDSMALYNASEMNLNKFVHSTISRDFVAFAPSNGSNYLFEQSADTWTIFPNPTHGKLVITGAQ
jgi:hypothetical protein